MLERRKASLEGLLVLAIEAAAEASVADVCERVLLGVETDVVVSSLSARFWARGTDLLFCTRPQGFLG